MQQISCWKNVYRSLKLSSSVILCIQVDGSIKQDNFRTKHGMIVAHRKHHLFPFSMRDSPGRNDKGFPHSSIGRVHYIQGVSQSHTVISTCWIHNYIPFGDDTYLEEVILLLLQLFLRLS